MKITETHLSTGRYVNIAGNGFDISVRMEKTTAIESLMHAASDMRRKQFRLQGMAEILDDAAAELLTSMLADK